MFITFEGPDGSGKSTQAEMLATSLKKAGHEVALVHFPRYDSPIGKLIERIIKGQESIDSFDALEMLYVADQLDWQNELNKLMFDDHKIVIADRYDMSTIAYYASKTGCEVDEAIAIIRNKWQYGFRQPDITFLMSFTGDLDDRRAEINKEKDMFELDENVLSSIDEIYKTLSEKLYTRYVLTFDGTKSLEENSNAILCEVNNIINSNKKYSFKDCKLFKKNDKIEPF